jgi:hypothetical protein
MLAEWFEQNYDYDSIEEVLGAQGKSLRSITEELFERTFNLFFSQLPKRSSNKKYRK